MGEGKLDFSDDNCNELVNPKELGWKWERVKEKVRVVLRNTTES